MKCNSLIVFTIIVISEIRGDTPQTPSTSMPANPLQLSLPQLFETYGKQAENLLANSVNQADPSQVQNRNMFLEPYFPPPIVKNEQPMDINALKTLMNRLKTDVYLMGEKSQELLNEKMRGVCQISKLRDGLKCILTEISTIQSGLDYFHLQIRKFQEYMKANKSKIMLVGQKEMAQLRALVQSLQSVTENMVPEDK